MLLTTLLPAILAAAAAGAKSEQQRVAAAHALRDTIHRLPAAEAAAAFAALERRAAPPPRQDKVDHFVVLYMENQAMLRTLGCQDLPGLDGVRRAQPLPDLSSFRLHLWRTRAMPDAL
jgi:hypothetical protein